MTDAMQWYAQLAKPEWAPPAWVFGPVWSVLDVSFATALQLTITALNYGT